VRKYLRYLLVKAVDWSIVCRFWAQTVERSAPLLQEPINEADTLSVSVRLHYQTGLEEVEPNSPKTVKHVAEVAYGPVGEFY
jgi:hypothetical protein